MITRRDGSGRLECIRQHDHGLISGAMAAAWRLGTVADDDVRFAVAQHDSGWTRLDEFADLDPSGRPHSFLDHPLDAKYAAYRAGLDDLEAASDYAGYLCSRHYDRFAALVDDPRSSAYLAAEAQRQQRLYERLPRERQQSAATDLAFIQLLDALSLFVCCNPPGQIAWSWYRDGFRFADWHLRAEWLDERHVRLDPMPFAEPVSCRYPTYRWDRNGALIERIDVEVILGA